MFYLAERPTGFLPMKDLRRLPGDGLLYFSPGLAYEMELAQQRREISLQLSAIDSEEILAFPLKAQLGENPEGVGRRLRDALRINFAAQAKWRRSGSLEPFKAWRRAIEELDVLVFQMSRVDWDEASGFALAVSQRPIIAVNRKDTPNRRTFSLLHEFAHLMLGQSGASDLDVDATRPPETQRVEIFCNAVAAAALMPKERVLGQDIVQRYGLESTEWHDDEIHELANQFGVSRIAILRRLLTFGRTTKSFYESKSNQWNKEWLDAQRRKKRQLKRSEKPFATNPPLDVFYNLGRPFVRQILDSVNANQITLHEASGHFGNLRVRHFSKLEQQVYTG
jgi:Zn-dependent peptidase ImmA (M78 family)